MDIDKLMYENKMNDILKNYISSYGEIIGELKFRIYCIKKDINYLGYSDYRSLEILLDQLKPEKISLESYLYYDSLPNNNNDINPKLYIEVLKEGYKVLLSKFWK
jgi:hypothetical protein